MKSFTEKEKHFIGTGALIAACLIFFAFFEESSSLSSVIQGFIIGLLFFLLLPLAYVRLVLKRPLTLLGFCLPQSPLVATLWAGLLGIGGFFVCWGVVYLDPMFVSQVAFPVLVETSFWWFVLYALFLVPLILAMYEVFFRGLVQKVWLGNTWPAVGIQWVMFVALLLLSTGLEKANIPLIISAFVSGIVAKKTDSVWFSLLSSYLAVILTDILFLSLH